MVPVDSGVLQGSILGPLLLIICINDLHVNVNSSKCMFFAADAKCYRCINTVNDCIALQKDSDQLNIRSRLWKLRFNASKCKVLTISRRLHPITFMYTIDNIELENVDYYTDFGIAVSITLLWDTYKQNCPNMQANVWYD